MTQSNSKSDTGAPRKDRVLLGAITAAHGIRGEVTIRSFTADPESIARYGALSDATGTRSFRITSLRATPKGLIARIEGVSDRNAAEALRGTDLYVPRAKLPKTKAAEFYHADLIGLVVKDRAGAVTGKVVTVANFGAGDLLEIRFEGARDTDYIPFTDACVPEVDIAGGFVVVVPPEMTGEPEPASDETDGEVADRGDEPEPL